MPALAALVCAAACGGAKEDELFGGGGRDGGGDGRTTGPTGPGGLAGPAANTTPGGDADASRTDAGGSDSGPGHDPGIRCGSTSAGPTYCSPTEEYCCANQDQSTFACRPASVSACLGLMVPCNDQNDCSGAQVCCGVYDRDVGRYTQVQCRNDCNGGGGGEMMQLCDPQNTLECSDGKACTGKSTALPGFSFCE